jgi:hypothetical protein
MKRKIPSIVVFVMFVAILGGVVFLATWDIPAPVSSVEKALPDDRFPR